MSDGTHDGSWFKSTFSSSGNCVETRRGGDVVMMRNSRDPYGTVLSFDPAAFGAFLRDVKTGALDLRPGRTRIAGVGA